MNRQIIAIDVDDVLSSQVDTFIEFSNENFGTNLKVEDFQDPGEYWTYYSKVWNVSKEEGDSRFQQFVDSGYPVKQMVTEEVKAAIIKLGEKYDLEIVTSRHAEVSEQTKEWLLGHFPSSFKEIHFTTLWDKVGERVTKLVICQKIGASFLIDDNAEHCNLAAEAGVKCLLFGTWGWNTYQELHSNVTRVADWQEVLEYFDARS